MHVTFLYPHVAPQVELVNSCTTRCALDTAKGCLAAAAHEVGCHVHITKPACLTHNKRRYCGASCYQLQAAVQCNAPQLLQMNLRGWWPLTLYMPKSTLCMTLLKAVLCVTANVAYPLIRSGAIVTGMTSWSRQAPL